MISSSLFRVTEYECGKLNSEELIAVFESQPMCLRDAGRFAAALSYARGAYVEVEATSCRESCYEWWYAGSLSRDDLVPPIRFKKRRVTVSMFLEVKMNPREIDSAIASLKSQGHSVEPLDHAGPILYEIDGYLLSTREEMFELGRRVCSLMEAGDQLNGGECPGTMPSCPQ
jgi:hypothetical protein